MTNPFEIADAMYLVLVNVEGQHCLWPDVVAVPRGWHVTFGPAARTACLDHVTAHWTDLRPRGTAAVLDGPREVYAA